jgi:hypothetical protein
MEVLVLTVLAILMVLAQLTFRAFCRLPNAVDSFSSGLGYESRVKFGGTLFSV